MNKTEDGVYLSREFDLYQDSKIMLPPENSAAARPMAAVYKQMKSDTYNGVPVSARQHVQKTWKPNPTLFVSELDVHY